VAPCGCHQFLTESPSGVFDYAAQHTGLGLHGRDVQENCVSASGVGVACGTQAGQRFTDVGRMKITLCDVPR
jgi:hypothetical protein